ncbi:CLUMA_CG001593, isoform A [Clunio marinus]|uniref:CLUMA_CG001593, isoform A n=1 Tax=Clunio marinus TaxID=568069 RepID=A0A1J1HIA2_9DIPT|nr:CLUMA_CG001593, isoform A [Clunio marinus]
MSQSYSIKYMLPPCRKRNGLQRVPHRPIRKLNKRSSNNSCHFSERSSGHCQSYIETSFKPCLSKRNQSCNYSSKTLSNASCLLKIFSMNKEYLT